MQHSRRAKVKSNTVQRTSRESVECGLNCYLFDPGTFKVHDTNARLWMVKEG